MRVNLIDPEKINQRFAVFNKLYMAQFDSFWKRKLAIESKNGQHILDDQHFLDTMEQLWSILLSWNAYRGGGNSVLELKPELKLSLKSIKSSYDQIRGLSLLDFDSIAKEPLELIWNELGRVKKADKRKSNSSYYYIIAICKPLMLLWGQTLAFDSKVRKKTPKFVPLDNKWNFAMWEQVMTKFQKELRNNSSLIDCLTSVASSKYSKTTFVPYGRFLDIYFFNGPDDPNKETIETYTNPEDSYAHKETNAGQVTNLEYEKFLNSKGITSYQQFIGTLNQLHHNKKITGEEFRRLRSLWETETDLTTREALAKRMRDQLNQ